MWRVLDVLVAHGLKISVQCIQRVFQSKVFPNTQELGKKWEFLGFATLWVLSLRQGLYFLDQLHSSEGSVNEA